MDQNGSFPQEKVDRRRGRKPREKTTHPRAFAFRDADEKLLDAITEHLACSRSEAVRTSLRIAAGQMGVRVV